MHYPHEFIHQTHVRIVGYVGVEGYDEAYRHQQTNKEAMSLDGTKDCANTGTAVLGSRYKRTADVSRTKPNPKDAWFLWRTVLCAHVLDCAGAHMYVLMAVNPQVLSI